MFALFAVMLAASAELASATRGRPAAAALHQPVTPARVAACTDHERAQQVRLFEAAYTSTHLWTACGDQSWLEALAATTAKKHHTFFDIGCNKGYETARMFELFAPAANVHPSNLTRLYGACEAACGQLDCSPPPPASPAHADATMTSICVEASRKTYQRTHIAAGALLVMPHNADPRNKWQVLHRAASNRTGSHSFPEECDTELCSVTDTQSATKTVTVRGITVDELMDVHALDYVDYMKIDTEGHDPAVLQGAARSLAARRVGLFQFEHHGSNLWLQTRLQDVVAQMKGYGYVCYFDGQPTLARLTDCWAPFYELKQWSNVVCVLDDHPLLGWMEGHSFLHQVRGDA